MVLINTLIDHIWGPKSLNLSQQCLEGLKCQTSTGVMVTIVFWFKIAYSLTWQRYQLLNTNFDSCMYMNLLFPVLKGSVKKNKKQPVDLVLTVFVSLDCLDFLLSKQHLLATLYRNLNSSNIYFWDNYNLNRTLDWLIAQNSWSAISYVKRRKTEDLNIFLFFKKLLIFFDYYFMI